MAIRGVGLLVAAALVIALPVSGFAQEATLAGTVSDSSGAVLPGVTIRAVHEATGNTIESVTDARGAYRLPARIGALPDDRRVSTDLRPITRTGIELAVGQTVVVNLEMALSSLQETVTVAGGRRRWSTPPARGRAASSVRDPDGGDSRSTAGTSSISRCWRQAARRTPSATWASKPATTAATIS